MISTSNKQEEVNTPSPKPNYQAIDQIRPFKLSQPQLYSSPNNNSNNNGQIRKLYLTSLPSDIIYRITEFLSPKLSSTSQEGGGPSHSSEWVNPGREANLFALTCRVIYFTVKELLFSGRHFGVEIRQANISEAHEIWKGGGLGARLRCIKDLEIPVEKVDDKVKSRSLPVRTTRSSSQREEEIRSKASTETCEYCDSERISRFGTFEIESSRIRHFYLNCTLFNNSTGTVYRYDDLLAQAIGMMNGLISFSYVGISEAATTSTSPWQRNNLGPLTLIALSKSKTLKKLYLCGIRLRSESIILSPNQLPTKGIRHFSTRRSFPSFDSSLALESVILAACHDSCLDLFRRMKYVKEIKIWRDFSAVWSGELNWWGAHVWESVEEIEFVGLAGREAFLWLNTWLADLDCARSEKPNQLFPLRTLCLPDTFSLFVITSIIECCSWFPNLTNLTFLIWRDTFNASVFELIAQHIPQLKELTLGLESESLVWWPGRMDTLAQAFSMNKNLIKFTWNNSIYADDTPFHSIRIGALLPTSQLISLSPHVESIHWIGENVHLIRNSSLNKLKWSDEIQVEKELRFTSREASGKGKAIMEISNSFGTSAKIGQDEPSKEKSMFKFKSTENPWELKAITKTADFEEDEGLSLIGPFKLSKNLKCESSGSFMESLVRSNERGEL